MEVPLHTVVASPRVQVAAAEKSMKSSIACVTHSYRHNLLILEYLARKPALSSPDVKKVRGRVGKRTGTRESTKAARNHLSCFIFNEFVSSVALTLYVSCD